jgi:hypothetical protein
MQENNGEAIGIALTLGVALALVTGTWGAGLAAGVLLTWAFSPVRPTAPGRASTARRHRR